jgi:hypothetical protein
VEGGLWDYDNGEHAEINAMFHTVGKVTHHGFTFALWSAWLLDFECGLLLRCCNFMFRQHVKNKTMIFLDFTTAVGLNLCH